MKNTLTKLPSTNNKTLLKLGFVFMLLVQLQTAWGQSCNNIYVASSVTGWNLLLYDPTNNSQIDLGITPNLAGPAYVADATGVLYKMGYHTTIAQPLRKYTGGAWTDLAIAPFALVQSITFDGTYIYALKTGTSPQVARYDIATDTWTALATFTGETTASNAQMVSDGTALYVIGVPNTELYKFTISTGTWSLITLPVGLLSTTLTFHNNKLYTIAALSPYNLHEYNISADTWTVKATLPAGFTATNVRLGSNGTTLYAGNISTRNLYSYDAGTNAWSGVLTTLNSSVGTGFELRSACSLLCNITATATATQNTCTSGTANTDGKLTLTAVSGASKVDYTAGSTYTGAGFATASTIGTLPHTVIGTLANPTAPQPYTLRVFSSTTCYKDYVLTLQPKQCRTADISVTVAPATETKNQAETATFVVTVANAGPDAANNVKVKVNIPVNGTLQAAVATQGNYTDSTKMWDVGTIANGASKTLTISVKVN